MPGGRRAYAGREAPSIAPDTSGLPDHGVALTPRKGAPSLPPMPRTVVVSDIHLGAIPDAAERAFRGFLERVPDLGDDLLINGDLFDFWFEYREVVPRGHFAVLAALRGLVERGLVVRFLGGNHDAWAGSFLAEEVGLDLVEGPAVLEVGGRRAYVAHGDGLGGGDWAYRALKRASRSRLGRTIFGVVHPDLGVPVARRASATEEKRAAGPGHETSRADRLAEHARGLLARRDDLDLVVFGHSHRPELEEVRPGRFYLNAGDWLHHRSYAVVSEREIRLERARHDAATSDPGEGSPDSP